MTEKEIARRERVKRIKGMIDHNLDMKMSATRVADWMYDRAGLEFRRGNDDEAEWYRLKYGVMCDMGDDSIETASNLFRRYQRNLKEDVQYSP